MSFNKRFAAHPVQIFSYLKPIAFVLLIPLTKALIDALLKRQINGLFLNEIILAALIIGYAVIKWRRFVLITTKEAIIIRSGLFLSRTAEIKRAKISSIQSVRYITDLIFGSITLRINTESGRRGKADFEIKLKKSDAEAIFAEIFPEKSPRTVKFSTVRVALMAATASSAFTGLVFIVPIIRQSGILLGTAIEEVLISRINELSAAFGNILPPVINTVTVLFFTLYAVAFLISFFKYVNFRVRIQDGTMQVISGLITRFTIVFKTKSVNSATIEQSPLMRLFSRYLVRVSIGGYGDNKGYKALVIPSAKENEVKNLFSVFFPNTQNNGGKEAIKPHKKSRKRFYFIPTVITAVVFLLYFILRRLFPTFADALNFALLIALAVMAYYYTLAEYNFKHSEIMVADTIYAKYSRWASTREMFCDSGRIGVIKITKWPADRIYATCNIRLTERSESAESITVKHIPYKDICNQLAQIYELPIE